MRRLTKDIANVDLVETLLSSYHANPNLPVGQKDPQNPMKSVNTLWLALQHPHDSSRSLVKLLLQHGASPGADMDLIHLIITRKLDTLDIFQEYDSENQKRLLTK